MVLVIQRSLLIMLLILLLMSLFFVVIVESFFSRGDVLGINRFGIQKMRASTLMLASFEETNEHLFEAAAHHRADPVKGVSESIIMGKAVTLGTGTFDILYDFKNQWTGRGLEGEALAGLQPIDPIRSKKRSMLLLSKFGAV